MSVEAIYGPGILFVRSCISTKSKDILDEKAFLNWYDKEHIPEVTSTSGIKNGFRYVDVQKTCPTGDIHNPKPFLACYPMDNLAFTQSGEFRQINIKSSLLPDSGVIYDLADMDVSYLSFLSTTPTKDGTGAMLTTIEEANYILTSGIRPEGDPGRDKVEDFYKQQTDMLSQIPHYIRTLQFKLVYARTNAQSRALKGLATTDEPCPEPSTWLAIHEFAALPRDTILDSLHISAEKILNGTGDVGVWERTVSEMHVWRLESVHGKGKFFDE